MNLARDYQGKAPSPKTCSEGPWLRGINTSGVDHEAFVVLDDREHKKGNLFDFAAAKINGAIARFPLIFVLDHNGRVINKNLNGLTLEALEEMVKKQEKVYDAALKKALKSKGKDSSDSEDSEEDKE